MRPLKRLCFGTALGTTVLMSGCISPNLFGWRTLNSTTTSAGQPASLSANAASNGGAEPIPTDLYGKMPTQPAATPTSKSGVVLASMWQAGKSVTNALKIQSKVSPAVDPVKLDNQPANTAQVAADLHYHAGYFFETQHKPADAAAHYRDALQKSPEHVRAIGGFGRVQEQLGNAVEAEGHLKKACELAPQDAAPRNDLAQFYARQKKLPVAIDLERQAVTLQPNNPGYRGALAQLLVDVGQHQEAVQQLAAIHGDAAAHFQVGCLLNERRQPELARQHLQQALTLNPNLAGARQAWERLQVASSSFRLPTP